MKIFLLFLCASFIIGANWQQGTPAARWLMGSMAAVMVTAYFLFDQFPFNRLAARYP